LKEIEENNGYAVTEPNERNSIVETIRGTLAALKTGFSSQTAVIAGLQAPLRFIAKKFGEASMGETAKIAVAALVKWLFSQRRAMTKALGKSAARLADRPAG
jgi:hypothetical protein